MPDLMDLFPITLLQPDSVTRLDGWKSPKSWRPYPFSRTSDKFGLSKEATASYFLHGHYVHRSSGSENELGLVFACISRVSGFLPREKATVLPRLKKPEARVFSTILG
jgi:hypothetical protein